MATIAPLGVYQAFDDNGDPLAGGFLHTYEAGTLTPKATYTTASGDTENSNPVELDASGIANVWLGDGGYKFKLTDADGNIIFTVDDIGGSSDTAFGGQVNELDSNTSITNVYKNSVNLCDGTFTISLLAASEAGEGFYISVKNIGSGVITIDPDAGELIDGQSTKTLGPGESFLIICDGSEWWTLFSPLVPDFTQVEYISGLIEAAQNKDYIFTLKAPYGGTITNTITKCSSGTCTATFKINSTPLGGTANAVSTSEVDTAQTTSNVFVAGDDLVLTISANSTALNVSFTVVFNRVLA